MFLKKEPYGPDGQLMLYELSALQRIEYLEYLDGMEVTDPVDDNPGMKQLAAFARRQAMVNAWLISRSMINAEPEKTEEELSQYQMKILRSWSLDALSEGAAKVLTLSGMVLAAADEKDNADTAQETASVEKCSGQSGIS